MISLDGGTAVYTSPLVVTRREETRVLALTFRESPDRAWHEASHRLFLRWLSRQGSADVEGQDRAAMTVEPPWSWLHQRDSGEKSGDGQAVKDVVETWDWLKE